MTTWALIRGLRDDGVTVVLTTHGMDEAEHLCDRIAIIDHGRIVIEGSPAELTTRGAGDDTRFSAAPGLDVLALAGALHLGAGEVVEPRPGEYLIAAPGTPDLVADLAGWLRDHHVALGELQAGRRSLEDVFLRLTDDSAS